MVSLNTMQKQVPLILHIHNSHRFSPKEQNLFDSQEYHIRKDWIKIIKIQNTGKWTPWKNKMIEPMIVNDFFIYLKFASFKSPARVAKWEKKQNARPKKKKILYLSEGIGNSNLFLFHEVSSPHQCIHGWLEVSGLSLPLSSGIGEPLDSDIRRHILKPIKIGH